jgi:hypothetical protein
LSGGGFVVGGDVKGLVGEKRLYLPPRASSDARTFFASVDVVGKYCGRDSCSLLELSLFFVSRDEWMVASTPNVWW